jgi:hypothetical protein
MNAVAQQCDIEVDQKAHSNEAGASSKKLCVINRRQVVALYYDNLRDSQVHATPTIQS